jgi:EH signature protein
VTFVREALVALQAATRLLPRAAEKLPKILASAKAVEALGATLSAAAQPAPGLLDAVGARLTAAFASPGGGAPARSDLRDAPWLLWMDKKPLAILPGLLDAIGAQALQSNGTRRNLIEGWLQGFSADGPRIAEGGASIRSLLAASTKNPRFDLWRRVDQRVDLFDHRVGPRRLASWLMQGPESVPDVLRATGFDEPLRAVGGYMRAVQNETLALAVDALRTPASREALTRLTLVLAPDDALRFPEPQSYGDIADGMLAPWLDGGREPVGSARDGVRAFLLRHLDDPRRKPASWKKARKDTVRLMRRWLTRASLKAFFDLISEHVLDSQWQYREAFWSACLDKDADAEAWLALGSQVHASARAVGELNGAYARLEGAGVSRTQAVLLLRIRNLVFCEWSHQGRLRVWPADRGKAPRLNLPSYTRGDLTAAGLPFPPNPEFGSKGTKTGAGLSHFGPERNYWQGSAAELLARRAGINLTPEDWKPR